jgi:hypothetical protein
MSYPCLHAYFFEFESNAPVSPNNDTSKTTKMVLCHTSVGSVLWKREKDNEMQKVELES